MNLRKVRQIFFPWKDIEFGLSKQELIDKARQEVHEELSDASRSSMQADLKENTIKVREILEKRSGQKKV